MPSVMATTGHSEMSTSRGSQDNCNKTFPDFSQHVLYQVNVQRFYGAFCDIVVKVENYSFKAHRCVLAAGSPKLQSMLYDYHQDRSHVLHLRDVTASGFKCILEFFYTGHLKFESSLYSDVLSASRILELPDIEQACMEFQFYRDMMSIPSSSTVHPPSAIHPSGSSSSTAAHGIQGPAPGQAPLQQTTHPPTGPGQHTVPSQPSHHTSGRVSSSQLAQQQQSQSHSARLSAHTGEGHSSVSVHTTGHSSLSANTIGHSSLSAHTTLGHASSAHPAAHSSVSSHQSKLNTDLIHQPHFMAQGLQQMQPSIGSSSSAGTSGRYGTSSSSQQVAPHHATQSHPSGHHGPEDTHSHTSSSQLSSLQIQSQTLAPSTGLEMHYSPTYKSPPPGGGHVIQPANHSIGHSTNQQSGMNKTQPSHTHTGGASSLPLGSGQGHLLSGHGHTEPVSQPQTPQPIVSVTPPPNINHPTGHGSLTLTPISTIDTNCIEDYLKMIESMQTEQQTQQLYPTSSKSNQVQSQAVSGPSSSSATNTNPTTPVPKPYQHKTPSSGTRNPKKDYIASADIAAASVGNSAVSSSTQISQLSSQLNQKTLSMSASGSGGGSRSQYSAEDVRKTLLSVLSQEQFDVTGGNPSQGNHGNQYSSQTGLNTKEEIYGQPPSTYSNKYYPSNSHSSVSQRLNFDNIPSQNSNSYTNSTMDSAPFSSNQYPVQYGGIEYSGHYSNISETNLDNNSVYSANSPAQAIPPGDGPSSTNRINYMNSAALIAPSSGRSVQYNSTSSRHQEAMNMINSYAANIQDRLSRLTPVDDNLAASALSSDSDMDDLTMEAIESLAEKMTAKDTPEEGGTPVQGEPESSPVNLMNRLSPISIASEPPHQQVTAPVHQPTQAGPSSSSQPDQHKFRPLPAAHSSLQAILPPSEQQPNQQHPSLPVPVSAMLPSTATPSGGDLQNTHQMAPLPESAVLTSGGGGQNYMTPLSPSEPMSPDFGKEDRKLKMKKKRKVPVKIKLKRNYSSEHWDTMSLPPATNALSTHLQVPTNENAAFTNKARFSTNQEKYNSLQERLKESGSLLDKSSHVTSQGSNESSLNVSGPNFMPVSGNYNSQVPNSTNFESSSQNIQNAYLGSPQSFSWDDVAPSQNKVSIMQDRVSASVPQMPAKFRLSSYHQDMYYSSQSSVPSSSQISQPISQSINQTNPAYFSGNQTSTPYTMQNYETSYPERGLEQLLEKSNDGYGMSSTNSQNVSINKNLSSSVNSAFESDRSLDRYARSSEYTNKPINAESAKTSSSDTISLTTINKDDLISEIDSLKRDHEESQAIERTKLKKKKKFFISADLDSSITSPKDSPKFRILKKKYRHSFVKSVSEKVKKPAAEKLSKKKKEKKEKKTQQHAMSTLEKKRSKALEIRKEAENRPLKKRLQLKPVPIKIDPSSKYKMKKCQKCGREFYKFGPYNHHMQLHARGEGHACPKCNMLFFRLQEVTIHLRQHNNVTFECTECLQIYSDAKDYKKHMGSVHQETNCFKCAERGCGYKAARVSLLEAHMETHKENKSYACTACGKTFKQANGMRAHMKSCVQKKTYLCEFCPSKFNQLQSLKAHVRTHTGEKPHKCSDCGAGFTDPKNLNRHRRIHLNVFPYPCKHCDKKFRHSNSLKKHMQSAHSEKV